MQTRLKAGLCVLLNVMLAAALLWSGCSSTRADKRMWSERADSLAARGQWSQAGDAYREALRRDSTDAALWEKTGKALWTRISLDYIALRPVHPSDTVKLDTLHAGEMIHAFQEAIRLDPKRRILYREVIDHCRLLKLNERANSLYLAAQQEMPDSAWVWSEYGVFLATTTKRWVDAVAAVDQGVALDSMSWEPWTARASVLERAGRISEAVAAWDKAIALNTTDHGARTWHRYLKGQMLMAAGRDTLAEAALMAAVQADRKNSMAWYDLAWVQRKLKAPLVIQLTDLDHALDGMTLSKPMPLYLDVLSLRGAVLVDLKEFDKAAAAFDTVLAKDSANTEALVGKARVLIERSRLDDALKCAEAALRHAPNSAEAQAVKADILTRQGYQAAAREADSKAAFSKAWGAAAPAWEESRRTRDSVMSVTRNPTWQDTVRAHRVANARMGRTSRAQLAEMFQKDFDLFLKKNPKTRKDWWENAELCRMAGHLDEAEEAYGHVIDLDPNYLWGWRNRAAVRAQLGMRAAAVDDLRRALQIDPKQRSWAEVDPDFERLWGEDDFEELVASQRK